MIIAVDFDGTIVNSHSRHRQTHPFAIETSSACNRKGTPILVGARRTAPSRSAGLLRRGLRFFAANENYPGEDRTAAPRKLTADLFIDDRNLGGLTDWGMIYHTIQAMEKGIGTYEAIMSSQGYDVPRKEKKGFFARFRRKMIPNFRYIYPTTIRHTTTIQRRYTTYCNNDSRIMLLKIHKIEHKTSHLTQLPLPYKIYPVLL